MIEKEFDMTPNNALMELLKDKELSEPAEIVEGKINIAVDDEVMEKLRRFRIYPTETYGSVILRLLLSYQIK